MEAEVEEPELDRLENTESPTENISEPDPRSPEDIEADEIERVFGPVDKKQEDVEQVWVNARYINI